MSIKVINLFPQSPRNRGLAIAMAVVVAVLSLPLIALVLVAGLLGGATFLLFYIAARAAAGLQAVWDVLSAPFVKDGRENVRVIRRG